MTKRCFFYNVESRLVSSPQSMGANGKERAVWTVSGFLATGGRIPLSAIHCTIYINIDEMIHSVEFRWTVQ